MSPELIYTKFLLKINKGNSGGNIACDRARFVLIFNEVKNRWVKSLFRDKDSILIDSLWQVVKEIELLNPIVKDQYVEFPLNDDFYEFINARILAKQDGCENTIYAREVKNQNLSLLYFDDFQSPDFNFEWTFCSIQGDTIRIYKKDFDVLKLNVEYYQVIPDIDISGYINIDNQPSTNIPIDLSDQYVDQIINLAVEEFMMDYENPIGLQMAIQRKKTEG